MRLLLLAALALMAAPLASAGYQPAYYFLKDGETGPVGDGGLSTIPPPPLDTANPANNSPPGTRLVLPSPLPPVQFVMLNTTDNTGWIYGPIIVLLYAPESPAMQDGNVTVRLVLFDETGIPGVDEPRIIASSSQANDYSNFTPPDPTAFVPPDPTDPEAAAAHIQAQLLAYGLPLVWQFPLIYILDDNVTDGYVNQQIDPGERLALQITLEPGSSQLPFASGSQPIEYDFALMPSLLYVPWYQVDPAVTPPPTPPPTQPSSPPATPPSDDDGDADDGKDKGSPGFGSLFAISALALAAIVARRRK